MPNSLILMTLVCFVGLFPTTALADDFELLTNRGFETGNLSGWIQTVGALQGHVVTVSGPTAQSCARIDPNTPHTGSYLFSSSIQDGATAGTPEITISQQIDITSFVGVSGGGASIVASGFFSGAMGCAASSSDDTAQILIEFFAGGPSGTLLDSTASAEVDPVVGTWNLISVSDTVPQGTDTIVMHVRTLLDPDFASIDIGVDDTSLILTVPTPGVPALDVLSLALLAAALFGAGLFRLRDRVVA